MKRLVKDKCQPVVDYFLKQVNVDLNNYRDDTTRQFDRRNMLTVDWESIPKVERQYIEQAAQAYGGRYTIQDAGPWMKCICQQ